MVNQMAFKSKKVKDEPDLMTDAEALEKAKELMLSGHSHYITVALSMLALQKQITFRQYNRLTIWIGSMLAPHGSLGKWAISMHPNPLEHSDEWEELAKQHSINWLTKLIKETTKK
jgi:hypothetical protein